ncbi:type II secretion system protein [Quatrionicoccus australiensis]|uniref:type II secretion system protein n=1 Tax=Quatrionicoccus australiensis TaxID=138118 RepID=UPI001CFC423D|nr:type II secretion system protein [Quatrionicoccus australiensis]MCB4360759.1 prepilin-type N-terminal cleavage/methylation domain-containing protein [Quatrionicoccus australiensis]
MHPPNNRGFSLIELSIVLLVVALLSSSLMLNFSAQQDNTANFEARHQLDEAKEALLGFAIAQNRLPCPAAPGKNGIESPEGGGNCSNPWDGYLPAVSLGIQPVNAQGYAIDPWGNPIRYALSAFKNPACGADFCLATQNGVRNAWHSSAPPAPDLRVCNTANNSTGSAGSAECASDTALIKDATAIIFSLGKNGTQTPVDKDEIANLNGDRLFVASTFGSNSQQFDDHLVWLSSNILYSRLIAAGRLP